MGGWSCDCGVPGHIHEYVWERRTPWEAGAVIAAFPGHIHECSWG